MYGMNNIKFINARQAKEIYQYDEPPEDEPELRVRNM
jgi:hypothetical protein